MTTRELRVFVAEPFFSQLRVKLTIYLDKEISRPTVNRNGQFAGLETVHLIDDAEFVPAIGIHLNGA